PYCGCAAFEHDLRDVSETTSQACVPGMDGQSPERDDACGIEYRGGVCSVFDCVASLEYGERFVEPPGPEQHAAMPGLEHLVGPALAIALGRGEAVARDRECLVVAVGGAQQ